MQELGFDPKQDPILVAVSGGVDSMVLWHLLQKNHFRTAIAHVNFGLRPAENEKEVELIQQIAEQTNSDLFIHNAETLEFARENKLSIQMAARQIRYEFFDRILQTGNYKAIATAHHGDDALENMFIYLTRNNMDAAFSGIAAKNGNIIRPMLEFSREEITEYAIANGIQWCEDSSNKKDHYLRNRIRHHIVPGLKHFYPEVLQDFNAVSSSYRNYLNQLHGRFDAVLKKYLWENISGKTELIFEIKNEPQHEKILQYYFRKLGFHPGEISKIINANQTGTAFYAGSTILMLERNGWSMQDANLESKVNSILINQQDIPLEIISGNYLVELEFTKNIPDLQEKNCWYFDAGKIEFPLKIREKEKGDRMQVFGMRGTKKISDILIDAKIEHIDKNTLPVLCDETGIMALIPLRRSAKYPVLPDTINFLKIRWEKLQAKTP